MAHLLPARISLAIGCVALVALLGRGELCAQPARISHTAKKPAGAPSLQSQPDVFAARLDMLSRLQAAAVQSGDAPRIAAASRELNAELLSLLGRIAAGEHRSAEAIELYRESLQLYPDADLEVRLASLLARSEQNEGALQPASPTVSKTQGAAASATQDAAQEQQALRTPPSRSATKSTKTALARPGQVDVVSPELRSAESQLRLMLSNGFNDLGTAEARQQNYEQALRYLQEGERFGPDTPALLKNIGSAAYRLNDSAEVQRALTKYFATSPAPVDPRARLMLAMAEFDLGRFAQATTNFREAGEGTMSDPRTAYAYALSLARSGQATEADAIADRLVAMGLPATRLVLVCNVYFTAENYKGAQECYERVAKEDVTMPRVHYFIGESLIHLDRPEEAVSALRAEQAITPDEPNVQASLAFALTQTGRKQEAQELLSKTVASHPENAAAQYQIGKLLAEQGKTAEAIPHLEQSVAQDPAKEYAHYQLAMAYRKEARAKDAEREFALYRSLKDANRNKHAIPDSKTSTLDPH